MSLQLYLHFPFCKSKCLYCDFCSAPGTEGEIAAYCHALEKEIALEGERWRGETVSTVFLGGGTPSVTPVKAMDGVLNALQNAFSLSGDLEFTSEANPGTLSNDWLRCVKEHGLNRLSLGVQAAQDGLLRSLGRVHTFQQAGEAFEMARRAGITNLNADLMFALPGQSLHDYRQSVEKVCDLGPKHIAAYSLIVEEGTPLFREVAAGRVQPPDDDAAADFYQLGLEALEKRGYRQYEISNFAMEGFDCRHNVGYWRGEWYVGLGTGAHGMLPPTEEQLARGVMRVRCGNTADVSAYRDALLNGLPPPREVEEILKDEAMFETMMLGLRMNRGVDGQDFEKRFGLTLIEAYGDALQSLVRDGLGKWRETSSFALTKRGLMVQNEALMRFMNKS